MKRLLQLFLPLVFLVVAIVAWNLYQNSIDISLVNTKQFKVALDANKPIRYFGVVSRYTPREIFMGYQPIMDFLTKNTPYQFELLLNNSYEGTAEQLGKGESAIASLGSLVYTALQEKYGLEVILKPLNNDGTDFYQSMFITQDSSSIQSLSDLKNRSLLLPSKESLTGKWMPSYISKMTELKTDEYDKLSYVSHHTTVAEKVLQGEFDAGVVKEAVAEIFKDRGIRVFHITPKRTTIPIVVSKRTDSQTRQAIIDALLSIDVNNLETKLMLQSWDEELSYGFHLATDEDYQMIRNIVKSFDIK